MTETVSTERLALQAIKERLQSAFGAGVWDMPSPNPNGSTRLEHQQSALFSIIATCNTALASRTQEPAEWQVEKCKLYHSQWPAEDLLKARGPYGLLTDDGEAWRYQYTHSDGEGGAYDLVYRPAATPPAPERLSHETSIETIDVRAGTSAFVRNPERKEVGLSVDEVERIILDTEPPQLSDKSDKIWTRRMATALAARLASPVPLPVTITPAPALLHGVCDSLRAAIAEYEDRDLYPGARKIMQAQIDAIRAALSKPGEQFECPINQPGCTKDCGSYGCGN